MAMSHRSKSLTLLLVLILLLLGSCSATRTGATMELKESTELLKRKQSQKGLPYQGLVFNFFPKGSPIPPSGPSKGHNSVVDSKPQN